MTDVNKKNDILKKMEGEFKEAYKIGFLEIFSSNLIKQIFSLNQWKDKFIVLSQVGILVFDKPGNSKPSLFISLAGAILIHNPIDHEAT